MRAEADASGIYGNFTKKLGLASSRLADNQDESRWGVGAVREDFGKKPSHLGFNVRPPDRRACTYRRLPRVARVQRELSFGRGVVDQSEDVRRGMRAPCWIF